MVEDWQYTNDSDEIKEIGKTVGGGGIPPFINQGVQKCTDCKRIVSGEGARRTGVLQTPSWDHHTTSGSSEGGRDSDGTVERENRIELSSLERVCFC